MAAADFIRTVFLYFPIVQYKYCTTSTERESMHKETNYINLVPELGRSLMFCTNDTILSPKGYYISKDVASMIKGRALIFEVGYASFDLACFNRLTHV
jgi:hypothetical protein